MEMCGYMIIPIHGDDNAEDSTDNRHVAFRIPALACSSRPIPVCQPPPSPSPPALSPPALSPPSAARWSSPWTAASRAAVSSRPSSRAAFLPGRPMVTAASARPIHQACNLAASGAALAAASAINRAATVRTARTTATAISKLRIPPLPLPGLSTAPEIVALRRRPPPSPPQELRRSTARTPGPEVVSLRHHARPPASLRPTPTRPSS